MSKPRPGDEELQLALATEADLIGKALGFFYEGSTLIADDDSDEFEITFYFTRETDSE